ncbi:hypothetical protein B0H15DRAFT_933818 [Mycena belliarum]|uniref:Uncharacterized protein n=1 Tax=Mycena belliarum TaxID=1033014 RepID=A0AAD6TSV4_9AGAR|nr:hypothetical protein B0H15DRAFT_933818 [Mycena belliae]
MGSKIHVAEPKAARNPSIVRAFKDLDDQLDTYFSDGLTDGRRRQRVDDQERLRELERSNSRLRTESHNDGQQLTLLELQLRAAQSECDALRTRLESLSNPKPKSPESLYVDEIHDGLEVERMLLDPRDAEQNSPAHFPSIHAVPRPHSAEHSAEHSSGLCPPPNSSISPSTSLLPIPTSNTHALAASLPPRPTVEVIASSGAPDLHSAPSFSSCRTPRTLRQLQYLMRRAHQPGNEHALAKIKRLCAEAHRTPREEKTELQWYILRNWRNPNIDSNASHSVSPPPPLLLPNQALLPPKANDPRIEDPVEVWAAFLTTRKGSWPRGVRRAADGTPHLGDLRASRTVARLRPAIGATGSTTTRTEFMACATQLFASPGMYAYLIRQGRLTVASVVSYRQHHAAQFSVTAPEVARHFAACGISVAEAEAELEPWAQEYQVALSFPTGSAQPRYKPYTKSPRAHSSRARYEPGDRFGWR